MIKTNVDRAEIRKEIRQSIILYNNKNRRNAAAAANFMN